MAPAFSARAGQTFMQAGANPSSRRSRQKLHFCIYYFWGEIDPSDGGGQFVDRESPTIASCLQSQVKNGKIEKEVWNGYAASF